MGKAIYDRATKAWFDARPGIQSTVMQCDECGLWYKPSLGHKCTKSALKCQNLDKKCKKRILNVDFEQLYKAEMGDKE